ncbi:MAG: FAD-dependent oxidoreductase [Bacteroidota bacterium]
MKKSFDLIVIGLGSAGLTLSMSMAKAGFKVLGIDLSDQNIGGDCLNYGCIPSKALIHVSHQIHQARQAQQYGLDLSGKVDFAQVKAHIQASQDILRTHENAAYLQEQGIEVVLGRARFVGLHEVAVGDQVFSGKKIAITTGSRPRALAVPGLEQVQQLHSNETIFSLDRVPDHLLVVGTGPIACELGQAFQRLGSKVSIVNRGARILTREPLEMAEVVAKQMEKEGVTFFHQTEIRRFLSPHQVEIQPQGQSSQILHFDAVLVAIGQVADFSEMGLEAAGVQTDESGQLIVNDRLQTSVPHIFAAGDAAGKGQFSHLAAEHASIILSNFFLPFKSKVGRNPIPSVTFTDPEIATFGHKPHELDKKGIPYFTLTHAFTHGHRAAVNNYTDHKMVVYLKKGRLPLLGEKILGGTIVAPRAGEMVQEFIMAQSRGMSFLGIMGTIHPYPSATNDAKAAFLDHVIAKIGPGLKKWLRRLY